MNVTTANSNSPKVDEKYSIDEILANDKPQVKQSTVSSSTQIYEYGSDKFDSVPEVEHYNNYNATGNHNGSNGATNGAKTASRERCIFGDTLLDISIFIKPGTEVFVSSARHKQPIQISALFDSEANRIQAYMVQGIQDFMAGRIDSTEIVKIIENAYRDLLAYNISLGRTDGSDPHYNARILFDVQGEFGRLSVLETFGQNNAEGAAYAKEQHGLTPNDRFVFYNAKFFHLNKELQGINTKAIEHIAQKEGFDFYNVHGFLRNSHPWTHCFNSLWEGHAKNLHISQMKNTNLEPPEDFKMFFAPQLFSQEDFKNGTTIHLFASDPSQPLGQNAHDFFIRVPRGMSLFRKEPLWLRQLGNAIALDKPVTSFDISKNLKFMNGEDFLSNLRAFFAEYVTDFYKGALSVWSGGVKTSHDVPFSTFFGDDKRMFHGSEIKDAVAHNDFISNFEFHMFLQW